MEEGWSHVNYVNKNDFLPRFPLALVVEAGLGDAAGVLAVLDREVDHIDSLVLGTIASLLSVHPIAGVCLPITITMTKNKIIELTKINKCFFLRKNKYDGHLVLFPPVKDVTITRNTDKKNRKKPFSNFIFPTRHQ